jgi:hypothetical protein
MVNRIGLMMLCATWIAVVGLAGCNGSATEATGATTNEQAVVASATATPCPCAKSPDGQCNCGQHAPGECPHAKANTEGGKCGCGGHGDAGCPYAQDGEVGCNCGEHGQPGQHDCAKHRAAEGAAVAPGPGGCPHASGGCPHAAGGCPHAAPATP